MESHVVTLRRNYDYPLSLTLAEARVRLAQEMEEDRPQCPCCGSLAMVARRKVHAYQARGLIAIYRAGAHSDYVDTAYVTRSNANMDVAKNRLWGLIEELGTPRPDGGRAGWYRLTPHGVAFVENRALVQKYAHVFDNRVHWRSGPLVSIVECLGSRFNYEELMG